MLTADVSFGHGSANGTLLAAAGFSNVIGYVSDYPDKNCTAGEIADWLLHGLGVGLVWEDVETDMVTGDGGASGLKAYEQAKAKGYDADTRVIFAADDRNTGSPDWPRVLAYMDRFATHVPLPGYYGDQDSIDWLFPQRPHWYYWQSDSLSYGSGRTTNAHLQQFYNDPRALSLPIDVNEQSKAVPFMTALPVTPTSKKGLDVMFQVVIDASNSNRQMLVEPGGKARLIHHASDSYAFQKLNPAVSVSSDLWDALWSDLNGVV